MAGISFFDSSRGVVVVVVAAAVVDVVAELEDISKEYRRTYCVWG